MAEVTKIDGEAGNYVATVKLAPRHVNDNCTACGDCAKAVTAEFPDEYNYGLTQRKGAYLPHVMAHPMRYVIDPRIVGTEDGAKAKAACKYDAVELDQQEQEIRLPAGAVVWATGWKPYDAAKIQPYGHGRVPNVVSSVEFERMADPKGPTGGRIVRPSDGKEAKKVAFIQCAGSRDRNHLLHCSRICCMASLKQTTYVTDAYEDADVSVYYIDIRAIDRFEDFYAKIKAKPNVKFIKSKPASIVANKATGSPVIHGVNTEGYLRFADEHDLVVLAVGMEPSVDKASFPVQLVVNEEGFIEPAAENGAIFAAGCSADALDVNRAVQSATAATLRAIQVVNRVAGMEG
jgi:quinone-modifying oxidoreductase subunit QmoA